MMGQKGLVGYLPWFSYGRYPTNPSNENTNSSLLREGEGSSWNKCQFYINVSLSTIFPTSAEIPESFQWFMELSKSNVGN